MTDAPSYQSIETFDYIVSPHGDDFGPFTKTLSGQPTLTGGLQEALEQAGDEGSVFVRSGTYTLHKSVMQKGKDQLLFCEPGVIFEAASDFEPVIPGISGMLCLGTDEAADYDGFVFEGNGCLLDGKNIMGLQGGPGGIYVSGCRGPTHPLRFSIRNFRAQHFNDYGLAIGRANLPTSPAGSVVGLVDVENFELTDCGWIRVWAAEHVRIRNGLCHGLPTSNIDGWSVTSQHTSGAYNLETKDVVFEDLIGDVEGCYSFLAALKVQGQEDTNTANSDITRDIIFRRCVLRGRPPQGGKVYIDVHIEDAMMVTGQGTVESLTFQDCTFDNARGRRVVGNASEGYVLYDHCEFINGSDIPPTTYPTIVPLENRPIVVRRPTSPVTYPNQVFDLILDPNGIYENIHRYVMVAIVSGGTNTQILFIPRGYPGVINTGQAAGAFWLSTGDKLKIIFSAPPTMMKGAPWF